MTSDLLDPGVDFFASRAFEWTGGPYRALGHTFQVRTESAAEFRPRLASSLAPLLDMTVTTPAHRYDVIDQGRPMSGRYVVYDNGSKVGASASRFVTAGRIHWLVNQGAILTAAPGVVQLHAGGVQRDGLTVVLPAPMDAGKSTTVAGLLRAGYSYLSDEVIEVGPHRSISSTFPKALALDRSSVQLLGAIAAPFDGAAAEPQWHVAAEGLSAGPAAAVPCRADLFVFPQYRDGADTQMEALTPGETAVALCESTFKFRERAALALPLLTELAQLVPARRLTIGDLTQAVELVSEELGSIAQQSHQGGHQHAR